MKIKKISHCCLRIEEQGLNVLTDPGIFGESGKENSINIILITHEHQDHFHIPAIREILKNNPEVSIVTNRSVDSQ